MLKVGLAEQSVHTRYAPTALVQASYLTAVATRMDSFWPRPCRSRESFGDFANYDFADCGEVSDEQDR
jgi:hypothetical protein